MDKGMGRWIEEWVGRWVRGFPVSHLLSSPPHQAVILRSGRRGPGFEMPRMVQGEPRAGQMGQERASFLLYRSEWLIFLSSACSSSERGGQ